MPKHMTPRGIENANLHARGWNAAVEAAAKIVDNFARLDHLSAVTVCDLASTEIRKLDRSMIAIDD